MRICSQIHLNDDSVLSVVEYAVNVLKVKHGELTLIPQIRTAVTELSFPVIVVGHSECGGVKHAIEVAGGPPEPPVGPIGRWLTPLVNLVLELPENKRTVPIVVRKSVERQIDNLGGIQSVRESNVKVHGWVYDLSTGRLIDNLDS